MRRKVHIRLWTFIFTLLLCTASAVSMAGYARAELAPGTEPPPTNGNPAPGGDPDWPDGKSARGPQPGSTRGGNQAVGQQNSAAGRQNWLFVWMMKVRMAFAAGFRNFFPF